VRIWLRRYSETLSTLAVVGRIIDMARIVTLASGTAH
jgi:hypothetical protein